MEYPTLEKTPIKEIIFSISYNEIIDEDCFEKFTELKEIKSYFKKTNPIIERNINFNDKSISQSSDINGYQLRNKQEVVQLRKGAFSYHYLNQHKDFEKVLDSLLRFWSIFTSILNKDSLTVTNLVVRYINLVEGEKGRDLSHFIQLYPKRSNDREVLSFQNSVTFKYEDEPDFLITTVSTKPNDNKALLDITVRTKPKSKKNDIKALFKSIRNVKNRAFFDSITAKALMNYINK